MFQCSHCDKEFDTERGLSTHLGMKHKSVNLLRLPADDEKLLDEMVAVNKDDDEGEGGWAYFNGKRAVRTVREIRSIISGYGFKGPAQDVTAVEAGFQMEAIRATAEKEARLQIEATKAGGMDLGVSVNPRILAAQRLAEDTEMEGDVFAAVVSPIELGMSGRVWVTGKDEGLVKEINGLLSAWNVMETINAAWHDMETYSAFYVYHRWKDVVPTPIHMSPKRVYIGPDTGLGPMGFMFIGMGDEQQTKIFFGEAQTGKEWNDWAQGISNKPLDQKYLSWFHLFKHKHKMYPYPWLAKAATPAYTRQIIEEMRLALVQGLINQLWLMTLEDPHPGELSKLRSVISANRAERVGFLMWRAGLKLESFTPEAVEQLLLPDSWWMATLDIFRRMGRPVRIISGEAPQKGGQSSGDAEIDVRIAQNKAMGHRAIVARKIVLDLVRQWSKQGNNQTVRKLLDSGGLSVNLTPIQLFLGEDLKNIWGPMWNRGMGSVRTLHESIGLDTDTETERMKTEKEAGFDEIYQARQQFAQRVATPSGEVTKSPEPGRPEGETVTAAIEDVQDSLLESFNSIDEGEDKEEKRRRVLAFIILMETIIRAHMRNAYNGGYSAAFGTKTPSNAGISTAINWEQEYIDGFRDDLLARADLDLDVGQSYRYRVVQHVQASWRRGYMDGVFQAKAEDGWTMWKRVLRPYASKSGACEICKEDSKRWHPITEPFWDHPYGVCSAQVVKFMRSSGDWESYDRQLVEVPLMDWEE